MSDNPFVKRTYLPDRVELAAALRAHNCRFNTVFEPWDTVEKRFQDGWLVKADWIIDYMRRAK